MDEKILLYPYSSPLGKMTMASDGKTLTGLWFDGQKYFGAGFWEDKRNYEQKELPVFEETIRWLDLYFRGKEPDFLPELSLRGTEFRKEIWKLLLEIPYGKTTTYGELAEKIAKKKGLLAMSAQVVGEQWGTTLFPFWFPVTAWSVQTEVSPDMREGWRKSLLCLRWSRTVKSNNMSPAMVAAVPAGR